MNVRDLGGLPTRDGATTQFGRVLRADNLQDLTTDDVDRLVGKLGLRDVIDLRTELEVDSEGPGPLSRHDDIAVHHHSLYPESGQRTFVEADDAELAGRKGDDAEIWDAAGLHYTTYLRRRPDSVVAALRVVAASSGASIIHCAAGKDRTGVISALALSVAEVEQDAIVADYVATGERMAAVLDRLWATPTYAADLNGGSIDEYLPRADSMHTFLRYLDHELGGPLIWLARQGWTEGDTIALKSRLLA